MLLNIGIASSKVALYVGSSLIRKITPRFKDGTNNVFSHPGIAFLPPVYTYADDGATVGQQRDVTSVAMLDSVVNKFQKNNIKVTVRGLNEASSIMIDKYGTHAKN